MNLLERMNKELDANFDSNQFEHQPEYREEEGIARSYLVSKSDQVVYIGALSKEFRFSQGEKIGTEISRKYNESVLSKILSKTDLKIKCKFLDSNQYFADYILEKA